MITTKAVLPDSIRDDLDPLYEFLLAKQQKAQKELAKKLRSAKYLSAITEWEQYLKAQAPLKPGEPNANLTIKQLADRRLWKNYKRVLQEGNARQDFSAKFSTFKHEENQSAFKSLLAAKDVHQYTNNHDLPFSMKHCQAYSQLA